MANKTFIRANAVYDSPDPLTQDDIEIVGATITRSGGRITKVDFTNSSSGGGETVNGSYASNAEAVADLGTGKLYKSTTLVNGSPIILITV